jgi:hypothetical protein
MMVKINSLKSRAVSSGWNRGVHSRLLFSIIAFITMSFHRNSSSASPEYVRVDFEYADSTSEVKKGYLTCRLNTQCSTQIQLVVDGKRTPYSIICAIATGYVWTALVPEKNLQMVEVPRLIPDENAPATVAIDANGYGKGKFSIDIQSAPQLHYNDLTYRRVKPAVGALAINVSSAN